jgi:hypothetical protein
MSGSIGTSVGRLWIAFQCVRNAARRSAAAPVVFQCNADTEAMSNGCPVPSLANHHGRKTSAQRIPEFQEAIRALAGDVGENHATAVQLGENLLIDT